MSFNANNIATSKSPAALMQKSLRKLMEEQGLWDDSLIAEIPKSWEKYGDMLLFDEEKYFRNIRWVQVQHLWDSVCDSLKAKRIALKHRILEDGFRSPNVKLVHGTDTWVEYKDNGVRYCWDVEKNMFCAGNAPERHRVATLKCEGETVVDMFAGIGYFTLPYLVKAKAKVVHACEWNPYAIKALKINLIKNKVADRCIVHEGDCSLVCPSGIADRVNLGLLPSSKPGWKAACQALNSDSGGTLHIHENVTSSSKESISAKSISGLKCEICEALVNKIDLNSLFGHKLCEPSDQESFSLEGNNFYINEGTVIKWKRKEWKMWALHVCHVLRDIFIVIDRERCWKTIVCNLHCVKSYAPHIDHLVLDVKCVPGEIKTT